MRVSAAPPSQRLDLEGGIPAMAAGPTQIGVDAADTSVGFDTHALRSPVECEGTTDRRY